MYTETSKLIRSFLQDFDIYDEIKVKEYTQAAIDSKINLTRLDNLCNNFDALQFPSVDEWREILENDFNSQDDEAEKEEREFKIKSHQERAYEKKLVQMFLKKYGPRELKEYISLWFENVYGKSLANGYGLTYATFQKCALIDLAEAKGDRLKAFNIGRKKIKGE